MLIKISSLSENDNIDDTIYDKWQNISKNQMK